MTAACESEEAVSQRLRNSGLTFSLACAGVLALNDLRGRRDLFGRQLQVSEVAVADSLAAAAVLVMGEAAEGTPLVLIRGGADTSGRGQTARTALRPADEDLFR